MKKTIITKEVQEYINSINNIPYVWAEYPLLEHEELPQFNRKIVLAGFNCPDLESIREERLEITINQVFTNKTTGKIFMNIPQPLWIINNDTWSYLRDDKFNIIEVEELTYDEEEVIEREKVGVKIGTIKYFKYLLQSKSAHLTDLFKLYLADYAETYKEQLNTI